MENGFGFGKILLAQILPRAPLCWENGKKWVKKTHNVTSDVDFSFSSTLNTKPISIKLKQKRLSKEENTVKIKQKKGSYGTVFMWDLQKSIRVGSKMLVYIEINSHFGFT